MVRMYIKEQYFPSFIKKVSKLRNLSVLQHKVLKLSSNTCSLKNIQLSLPTFDDSGKSVSSPRCQLVIRT